MKPKIPLPITVHVSGKAQEPDRARVVMQFFPGNREDNIETIRDILKMNKKEVDDAVAEDKEEFGSRHRDIESIFKDHFLKVENCLPANAHPTEAQKILIGAYFTKEFSVESAALFNPSMIAHPDQPADLPEDSVRFIKSLRATGEGHVSSIVFRTGIIDKNGNYTLEEKSPLAEVGQVSDTTTYKRDLFEEKLKKLEIKAKVVEHILETLGEEFTYNDFSARIKKLERLKYFTTRPKTLESIENLGLSDYLQPNYTVTFPDEIPLSGRVLFPRAEFEKKGLEDARFVKFTDDDGHSTYYGTYTAYDGNHITPQLIQTDDFKTFKISAFTGDAAQGKGMALFPRKIKDIKDGKDKYVMLGRKDGKHITVLTSDNINDWNESVTLPVPKHPWNLRQMGNCGSPIETTEGWLVLTHGVGRVRKYSIGAILLDLNDPTKIIGEIKKPILMAKGLEREGYVPNVVYTCGAMRHGDHLVLPYAAADQNYNVATLSIKELLAQMEPLELEVGHQRATKSFER